MKVFKRICLYTIYMLPALLSVVSAKTVVAFTGEKTSYLQFQYGYQIDTYHPTTVIAAVPASHTYRVDCFANHGSTRTELVVNHTGEKHYFGGESNQVDNGTSVEHIKPEVSVMAPRVGIVQAIVLDLSAQKSMGVCFLSAER